jgi:large subunit ribosomal protein L25
VSEVRIVAEPRTEFGKGAARRIRRASKVPAVLYGHGTDPRHISLPGHELMLALKTANVLLTLDLQGKTELALPKDVQRDPVKGFLEHVDLLLVRRGEKVKVEIPLHVVGEVVVGGLVANELTTLEVEAEATNIPQFFEIDVEGREIGTQIVAKDIVLPAGVTLVTDPEHLVVHITAAPTAEELEAELAEAEAEAGIEREAPQAAEDVAERAPEREADTGQPAES